MSESFGDDLKEMQRMNKHMTHDEFHTLLFRQDLQFGPIANQNYRCRDNPNTVVVPIIDKYNLNAYIWWAFGVTFTDV